MGYIDKSGGYYEGDRQGDDQEVPARPSPLCDWDGSRWVESADRLRASIQAQIDAIERDTLMNRGNREMAMRQIEERAQLDATAENTVEQILASQPFYVRLKQVDDQVSALRVQL